MLNHKRPTRDEKTRFDAMQERGCVPCWLEAKLQGRRYVPEPGDVHHVEQANAVGHHLSTYLACPWHHRGVRKNDLPTGRMLEIFGPSMALHPKSYRARYGAESDLLEYQRSMLLKSVAHLTGGRHG